jgi:hypothetical protein
MPTLILNSDIDMIYPHPDRDLKPYERPVSCPKCKRTGVNDFGAKFHPRYGCDECGAMFDLVDIKAAIAATSDSPGATNAPTN